MWGLTTASWRPDPWAGIDEGFARSLRWWNGAQWTESVRAWDSEKWVDGLSPLPHPDETVDSGTSTKATSDPASVSGAAAIQQPELSPPDIAVSRPNSSLTSARQAELGQGRTHGRSHGQRGECPACGETVADEWAVCPICGQVLPPTGNKPGDADPAGRILGIDGEWHTVQPEYKAGDIANDHILGEDNAWHPVVRESTHLSQHGPRQAQDIPTPQRPASSGSTSAATRGGPPELSRQANSQVPSGWGGVPWALYALGGAALLGLLFMIIIVQTRSPSPEEVAAQAGCNPLSFAAFRSGYESMGMAVTTEDVRAWIAEGGCS